MTYITNATAIILILSTGEKIRVEKTDKHYPKILQTFDLPADEQESAVKSIISPLSKIIEDGFVITPTGVTYDGEALPDPLVTKIKSIVRDGLPLDHFKRFWENLKLNPSYHVVNETGFFDFLDYKELPITEDGCFLAFRGVGNDYWSLSGDVSTKVLQGKTNDMGQIHNEIGSVIEVLRNGVCDDRSIHCAAKSLHIGSLDYAKSWGPRVIIVKVNPRDVVSVPNDCSCQKCRVCKYEVIGDFVGEITSSVVDEDGGETLEIIEDDSDIVTDEYRNALDRISQYLLKKSDSGVSQVTLKQIQNIFSPNWINKETVLNILQDLWCDWEFDSEIGTIVVSTT